MAQNLLNNAGSTSAVPVNASVKAVKSNNENFMADPFTTCSQCLANEPTILLYMSQCMHSFCANCINNSRMESLHCFCGKMTERSFVLLVNKIRSSLGTCQSKRKCKNKIAYHCMGCCLYLCQECTSDHRNHQLTVQTATFASCAKHPKIAGKYVCGCGAIICHSCSRGYDSSHKGHEKRNALSPASYIDSMETLMNGASSLQSTTRNSYQSFVKEKDIMRNQFKTMKVELCQKAVDIVNTVMRKVNDCVIAMELFEKSYVDNFDNFTREYKKRQRALIVFKRLAMMSADNYPDQHLLPFVRSSSTTLSSDVSFLAGKMNDIIEMYRTAPALTMDIRPVIDSINNHTRFFFKNQHVMPPPKTDPNYQPVSFNLEDIESAIMKDAGTLRKRVGDPNGPIYDSDAKKRKVDNDGTNSVPEPPTAPSISSLRSPEARMFSIRGTVNPFTTKLPNTTHTQIAPTTSTNRPRSYDPRAAAVRSIQNNVRQTEPNPLNRIIRPPLGANQPVRNRMPAPPMNPTNHVSPRFILPRQPFRTITQSTPNSINSPIIAQRPPIVPNLKEGNLELQKQLNDVLNAKSMGLSSATDLAASPRPQAPQYVSVTAKLPSSESPAPPVPDHNPSLPPIKLTLRRNTVPSNSSETPEKELKKADDWDDYCFVCNQGCDEISGELVCCETCPKVYHNVCHVPRIPGNVKDLPDDWRCTRCQSVSQLAGFSNAFTKREQMVCARVLLKCYECSEHSEPFHNPIPSNVKKYYEVIKKPMCFKVIAGKLSDFIYPTIQEFVDDMNLVFSNCTAYNKKGTPVEESCRKVYDLYTQGVKEMLPAYVPKVWLYVNSKAA